MVLTNLEIDRVIRAVADIIRHPPPSSDLIQQEHKQQLTRAPTKISLSLSSSPAQSSLDIKLLSQSLPSPPLTSPDNLNPFKLFMKGDG